MAATPQSQAIATANSLISLSQQLLTIYQQMIVIDAAWTDNGQATILAALKTALLNTDGSIGAIDGTVTAAHPISPVDYPSLSRALTAAQITQLKTILDGIVTYINGQAVTATPAARGILNFTTGG